MPKAALPVVTVVMPAFNSARHLRDSVGSLRAQTFEGWECVIVDDGSTDDTPSLLAELEREEPRIRVKRQQNAGPAIARNLAIESARGEFIQFLDADDVIPEWKLAVHVDHLRTNLDVDIVHGPSMYFDDGAPDVLRNAIHDLDAPEPARVDGSGKPIVDLLLRHNTMTIEAPLTRRVVFDELGSFDRDLRRITDWEFWLRCAIAGKRFRYLPADEPVALIRVHNASLSHDETVMRLVEIEMRHKLTQQLPPGTTRDLNASLLAEVSANTGIALGLAGDLPRGLRLLIPAAISARDRSWLMWSVALLGSPLPPVHNRLMERRYGRGRGQSGDGGT
jgi:glycosyltransferase involved in cell wall biosynthesis